MAITIPNTFVAGTKIEASPMNANFAEVANAVDKRGDTVTGNIAANAGVKFDGVDLSTIPNSSGTFDPLFAQVVIGSADTNGIRLDLESGTLAVREGNDSAYAPLITGALTTTGVLTIPAGAVGAPTLTFSGDTNTGWWAPAADTLAASTGGVERLRITSVGTVGLGLTPSTYANGGTPLEIGSAGNVLISNSAAITLAFNATYNSAFYYGTSNLASYYQQLNGVHLWTTAPTGTAGNAITFTERMRLTSEGYLTLGTSTAMVSSAGRGNITINGTDAVLAFGNSDVNSGYVYSSTSALELSALSTRYLAFATNGSERARIDSSGNLGVGTTAPSGLGKVACVASTGSVALFAGYAGATTQGVYISNSTGTEVRYNASGTSAGTHVFQSGGTDRLQITTTGHVAIGATARLYLDGVTAAGNTYIEENSADLVHVVAGGVAYGFATAAFGPISDNARSCGALTNRWTAVYAVNGTIQTSDRTKKRDITATPLGLDFVRQLRPVEFRYVDEAPTQRRQGLIAQEVLALVDRRQLTGILTGTQDGEYGLNYAGLVPALIAAIQAQDARIAALEAQRQ